MLELEFVLELRVVGEGVEVLGGLVDVVVTLEVLVTGVLVTAGVLVAAGGVSRPGCLSRRRRDRAVRTPSACASCA